jgi:predicted RecB family nuclease
MLVKGQPSYLEATMSRTTKKRIIFGGYDAKSCPEKIRKTYDPYYKDVELDEPSPGDLFRMNSGVSRETDVGIDLKNALDRKIAIIPACDRSAESKAARESKTLELMENRGNYIVIWNARLPQNFVTHRTGEPDALVYNGINKETGKNIWLPVDVKDHKSLEGEKSNPSYMVSQYTKPKFSDATLTEFPKGTPQKVDALQLAHYHRMLEQLGYANSKPLGGIIGREGVIIWHDLTEPIYRHKVLSQVSAMDYYDHEFNIRVDVASNAIDGIAITGPELKEECGGCQFKTVCHDELELELDHITLLSGLTPDRAKTYYDHGITKIQDLAYLDYKTAVLVDAGINVEQIISDLGNYSANDPASMLISDTSLLEQLNIAKVSDLAKLDKKTAKFSLTKVYKLAETIDIARVKKIGKVHLSRGVGFVPLERTGIEEDIDIEDSNGFVYLIGVQTYQRRREGENYKIKATYHAFETWTQGEAGEARVFAEFWEHIVGQRHFAKSNKWGYRAYHYTHHEPIAFRKLAARHAGKPGIPTLEELNEFLDSKEFIDMFPILTTEMIWPTESLTLKSVAKWARFHWRDSDPGGGNSLAWYKDAVDHPDEEVRLDNRKRLKMYNHDDVAAQVAIRNWLSDLGEARVLGKRIPKVDSTDKRFSRKRAN